jgi:class 3 adenylate cyclase
MDFRDTPEEAAFRQQVRGFLKKELPERFRGIGWPGLLGDGFMASFSSATRALECAIAMQRAFAEHNETAEEPIRVRVGLNAGEPIEEKEDLFGTAVIVAARIAAKAEVGEILASDVVLRGFEDPVRLYEVRWEG